MSLINDALKKAQNLQTRPSGAAPAFPRPTVPAEPANVPSPVPAPTGAPATAPVADQAIRKGKSPSSGLIVAIASVVLLAGLGAIGYVVYALFFMGTPTEQVVATTPTPTATATAAAAESAPTPAPVPSDTIPSADAAPSSAAVSSPVPEKTAAPVAAVSVPASTAVAEPETPAADDAADLAAVADPEPEFEEEIIEERINNPKPHIQAWVDKITVSGIRPGENPKALMNDRVYVIGDVVNREFGLELHQISDRLLVFEDNEGNTYDYTF